MGDGSSETKTVSGVWKRFEGGRGMARRFALLALVASCWLLGGCAVAHRYGGYRGRVLELGTDAPIERAGVLAVYGAEAASVGGGVPRHLGYQLTVTDKEGFFEIPAKTFLTFQPLGRFSPNPHFTIYKRGYGNFPTSFYEYSGKYGTTDPAMGEYKIPPPGVFVTYRLPRLESEAEIREHDRSVLITLPSSEIPPKGMSKTEFRELFGHWEGGGL